MTAEEFIAKFPDVTVVNNNCLEDRGCTNCGQRERLAVTMTAVFALLDSGTDDHEDTEWDVNSPCECKACGRTGTVADFEIEGLDALLQANQQGTENSVPLPATGIARQAKQR